MSFNKSAEVVQEVSGGRMNISVTDDDSFTAPRQNEAIGEYGLVQAVLREAIRDYQKFAAHQTRREARLFREVDQWFLEDDGKWDFSFINVCQILNLEPTYIRTGLRVWCNRNVKQTAGLRPEVRDSSHVATRGRPRGIARNRSYRDGARGFV
jgi:hypothetical protein